MLVAAWLSEDKVMRVAAVFFLVFPASLAGMFACIARAPPESKPAEGGAYDEESAPGAAPRIGSAAAG